jgi:hypothetical protein
MREYFFGLLQFFYKFVRQSLRNCYKKYSNQYPLINKARTKLWTVCDEMSVVLSQTGYAQNALSPLRMLASQK